MFHKVMYSSIVLGLICNVFYFILCVLKGIAVLAARLTASKQLRFGLIAVPTKYEVFPFTCCFVFVLWLNKCQMSVGVKKQINLQFNDKISLKLVSNSS